MRTAIVLLLVVIAQGILGGLTVTMKLNPLIVTLHLTLATLFFQTLVLLLLQALKVGRDRPAISATAPFRRLLLWCSFAVFLQIALGGFVGASGASLVCDDFPLCNGRLLPQLGYGPHAIQATHRLLGYLVFALTLFLFIVAKREHEGMQKRRGHLGGMFALVVIQILVGVGNIHLGIAPAMTIAHLVLAQVLLVGLLSLYLELEPSAKVFR